MESLNDIVNKFPEMEVRIPDSNLIYFAHEVVKNNLIPDDMYLYIGMLKYIHSLNDNAYEKELKMLLTIYRKVYEN